MSNSQRNVLYIGVTNNLERRVYEHKKSLISGFTHRYGCTDLVYFEESNSIELAIAREKQLKKWGRAKKEALIDLDNAERKDLSGDLASS